MSAANKIDVLYDGRTFEREADAVITPGMRVLLEADNKVVPHSVAAGLGVVLIALADYLQGKTVADNYAAGDNVIMITPRPGDIIQVLLLANETVAIGGNLVSNASGKWIAATGTAEPQTDFTALEASNVASDVLIEAMKI